IWLSGYLVIWLSGVRYLMKISKLIIVLIVALLTFTGMYVSATMNAIGESYQEGVAAFKLPFQLLNATMLVICVIGFCLVMFSERFRISSQKYMISFSQGVLLATVLVFSLSFAPCLITHPTDEAHSNHHNLQVVVERSLLCPRYSNRSYSVIFLYSLLGISLFIISRKPSHKNA
ncbi:hypothetical protein, partial [Colwellia sp. Bg11-12]|uniref:hypothetical protein n=1 Tax=Colwellia sp. Bg11-12 TaxID=2759817 RepID=UPI001C71722A